LRTKGRENEDLGAVAPSQGFCSVCKWVKPVFLLGCYGCIFHRTGNSAQLCQNFGISGGWFETPKPPPSVCHCSEQQSAPRFSRVCFCSNDIYG
jgi:hypothetical protein